MQTRMTLIPTKKPAAFSFERDIRSAIITLEWKGWKDDELDWVPYAGLSREVFISQYAPLVHPFSKTGEWSEPKLKKCDEFRPGKWNVEIELPYLD